MTKLNYDNNIRNNCLTEVKNRFTALQETNKTDSSANTRYNYFEKSCKEAANKNNPVITKTEQNITLLINLLFYQNRHILYQTAKLKDSVLTPENIKHFKLTY